GGHRGKVAGDDPAGDALVPRPQGEVYCVAHVEIELDGLTVEVIPEAATIRLLKDVSGPQPRARGRAVGGHWRHDHGALALPVAHRGGTLHLETNPRPAYGTGANDLVGHAQCPLDRNGEAQSDRPSAAAENRGIDADDFTQRVGQWSAGIARVDRGVRLD